jgi:hypothetical protein
VENVIHILTAEEEYVFRTLADQTVVENVEGQTMDAAVVVRMHVLAVVILGGAFV